MKVSLNELRDRAYQTAKDKGWHDDENHPATFGDRMALIHSEVSEALEEFRAGRKPTETYYTRKVVATSKEHDFEFQADVTCKAGERGAKPCGIGIEIADILIRCLDLCGREGIDIEAAVLEKMAFNETRAPRHGGKKL